MSEKTTVRQGLQSSIKTLPQEATVGDLSLSYVPTSSRESKFRQSGGLTIFLTGLWGAGKTSIAREIGTRLASVDYRVTVLDGGELRSKVTPDLGFSRSAREKLLRWAGITASEVVKHGGIAVCSFIAPYEQSRCEIRDLVQQHGQFFLVHVSTPQEECERRDQKGLYRQARAGQLESFTGVTDVYEVPCNCDVAIDTTDLTVAQSVQHIARALAAKGLWVGVWLSIALRMADTRTRAHPNGNKVHSVPDGNRYAQLFCGILQMAGQRRVSLNNVAAEIGVERHTIERIVRSMSGQSFRQLHHELLLDRAHQLLKQGKPIKEIAFELGFGSPQAFHRFVRRECGKTPTRLRGCA